MTSLTEMTLTAPQLDAAAADLRNAALVVEHAGHTRGTLLSLSAEVCALGAIELSTYRKMRRNQDTGYWAYEMTHTWTDAESYRFHNAVRVFAEYVPGGLCTFCSVTSQCLTAGCHCDEREPHDVVTHWNDNHCESGDTVTGLLRLAADRATAAAADRRHLLTGDRIQVPVTEDLIPVLV